ncbi:MAG: hypothetical protein ACJA1C_000939 [Crocinitomicaceae bacterium]|jgi:hypothetical protein
MQILNLQVLDGIWAIKKTLNTLTMKNTLIFITFCIAFCSSSFGQVPRLEIHHIGAGDGDAALVIAIDSTTAYGIDDKVIWDTCVVLIDGQRSSGGKEVWRYVKDTISTMFPTRLKIDYIVASHLHIDHYGGLTNLIKSAVAAHWTIGGVVTRKVIPSATITNAGYEIDTCYSDIILNTAAGVRLTSFFKAIADNGIAQPAVTVGDNLFHFQKFVNISMQCIGTVGTTYNQNGDALYTFLPSNGDGTYTAKSENDLSYCWLFSFQGFHYTSFGDLGGISGGNYVDGESYVANYLIHRFDDADYHLCVHKVSHHGSKESTTQEFAKDNDIFLAVIPACLKTYGKSVHPLPTQTAIENLLSNPRTTSILYTFIPKNPDTLASYWTYKNLHYYNDVIMKVIGGPGTPDFGENLPIQVIQRQKDLKYNYVGAATVNTSNCTKGHNW